MDLSEFLLARIAEDEAGYRDEFYYGYLDVRERLLAVCEAHRRIVELHHPSPEYDTQACVLCQWDRDCDSPVFAPDDDPEWLWPCPTLRALAAIYADHPDYRSEWA